MYHNPRTMSRSGSDLAQIMSSTREANAKAYQARRHHGACRSARTRSDVHPMLSALVAVAAFAPPAARTWPHTARPVVQPLRAAQPLCKVRDPNDKVIYVGASPAATTHPAIRPATNAAIPPAARPAALRSLHRQPQRLSTQTTHPARTTRVSSHAAVRVTVGRRQQPDDAAQGDQGPRGPLRQAGGHPKRAGGTRLALVASAPMRRLTCVCSTGWSWRLTPWVAAWMAGR